jgi:hypothetical protein
MDSDALSLTGSADRSSWTGQSADLSYGPGNGNLYGSPNNGYGAYGAPSAGKGMDAAGLKGLGSVLTILLAAALALLLYIVIAQCQQAAGCGRGNPSYTSTQATLLDRVPSVQTVASRIKGLGKKLAGAGLGLGSANNGHGHGHGHGQPLISTSGAPGAYGMGLGPAVGGVLASSVPSAFPMPNTMAHATGVAAAQTLAAASHQYATVMQGVSQGGGQQASGADVRRVADTLTGANGAAPLGSLIQQFEGPYLAYEQKTSMQPLAGVDEPWNDSTKLLEFLDPKGAAQLAQALSLSATPGRFFASDTDARAIQAEQRAKYWRRNGKLDLTQEEILDDRPVWVPTAAAIRQAVLGEGVDRTIASSFPRRFAYPDMAGGRMATPRVVFTKDSVIQEPMLPGYDVQLSSQACNTCLQQTMEPL